MAVIYYSNVRFADWVKRHACGLPTAAAVAASEKAVVGVLLLLFRTRLCRQSPYQTSDSRTGSSVTLADRRHGSAILVTQSCKIMVKKRKALIFLKDKSIIIIIMFSEASMNGLIKKYLPYAIADR